MVLGTATLVAGLGSRRRGAVALALTACAGAAAVGAMRTAPSGRGEPDRDRQRPGDRGEPEVERSITIGRTEDELRRCWLHPGTLPQLMEGFATVRAAGEGRMHWKVDGPLGHVYEWESETVDDGAGGGVGWRSLADAAIANEGSVRFRAAPAGRGTVATLHVRFDPPGGALGDAAVRLLGRMPLALGADAVLRRFRSLAETGEIPTTARQPAARADTR